MKPAPQRRPAEDSQRHRTTNSTVVLSLIAAIGGLLSAIFSGWQALVASDTEKRQLRAYVLFSITNPVHLAAGSPITVNLLAQNSGQTPVRNLSTRATMVPVDNLQLFYHTLPDANTLPIIQEGAFFGKDHYMQMSSERSLTQDEIDKLGKGSFVGFVGVISYEDVFGSLHQTYFCRYYPGTNAQVTDSCPVGNMAN